MTSVYLDHNADYPVLDSAWQAYARVAALCGNPSSAHALGREARDELEAARARVAQALGATPDELVFTSGGTEALALAILGALSEGSAHVVSSALEHKAVDDTLRRQRDLGRISWARVHAGRDGVVSTEALTSAFRRDTRLVCVTAACNETGVLQPWRDLAAFCADRGVLCLADTVQWIGKEPFHFDDSGLSFATVSGHKLGAMPGTGALLIRRRRGVAMRGVLQGGGQEGGRRPGTENVAGAASLAAALTEAPLRHGTDRIAGLRNTFEHEVCAAVADVKSVEVVGGSAPRLSNTSCLRFERCAADALMMALDMRGFMVGTGSACATGALSPSPILLGMGLTAEEASSAIRVSLGHESNWEGLARCVAAIAEVVAAIRAQ